MKKAYLNIINNDLKFVYSENESISIVFQDNNILKGVLGELNSNIKELESLLIKLKQFDEIAKS